MNNIYNVAGQFRDLIKILRVKKEVLCFFFYKN